MIDCVVVGAGPAGLAASAALAERGVEHVVLERDRVGQSWRTQRWDSFRLNTPGWMNAMLGEQARYAYATGAEVVAQLEKLAAGSEVREGTWVTRLQPTSGGYLLRTGTGEILAQTVVIATGDENVPRLPAVARSFPGWVAQYHAADYRRPGQLPDGAVLVVGSGQSGCQIAEDLLAAGRQVVLATSPVGRAPIPYRGRPTFEWLDLAGFVDQRPQDLPDPVMTRALQPVYASGGRPLSLQSLARSGARLAGRVVAVDGEHVRFGDNAAANVAFADAFAARIRGMLDEVISRAGVQAPPAEPDDADTPLELDPPAAIELGPDGIGGVVWCTGFGADFSWLDPALLDADGRPRHAEGAMELPGVWCTGLRWLSHRASSNFHGFPKDAARIADAVLARLR